MKEKDSRLEVWPQNGNLELGPPGLAGGNCKVRLNFCLTRAQRPYPRWSGDLRVYATYHFRRLNPVAAVHGFRFGKNASP